MTNPLLKGAGDPSPDTLFFDASREFVGRLLSYADAVDGLARQHASAKGLAKPAVDPLDIEIAAEALRMLMLFVESGVTSEFMALRRAHFLRILAAAEVLGDFADLAAFARRSIDFLDSPDGKDDYEGPF
jgi:hypothetical protein